MRKSGKISPPRDFESAIAELEGLVASMESGEISLEESLTAYRRGIELTAYCQKTLADAEQQVRMLEDGLLKGFTPGEEQGPADDE